MPDATEAQQGLTVDPAAQRTETLSSLISTLVDYVVDIFHHRLLAFMEEATNEDTVAELLTSDLSKFTVSLRKANPPQSHPVFATRIPRESKPYAPKDKYLGIKDQYSCILSDLKRCMASLRRTLCSVLEQIADEITIIPLVNKVREALEIVMQDYFVDGHPRFGSIQACLEAENLKTFFAPYSGNVLEILSKDFSSTTPEERSMFAQYIRNHWMRANGYTYDKIANEVDLSRTTVWRLLKTTAFPPSGRKSVELLWNWLKERVLASQDVPESANSVDS